MIIKVDIATPIGVTLSSKPHHMHVRPTVKSVFMLAMFTQIHHVIILKLSVDQSTSSMHVINIPATEINH